MSCDHQHTPISSMHLEVLKDEAQNLKDESQREERKQANTYQRISTKLRDIMPVPQQQQTSSARQLEQDLQQKVEYYNKVQKILSLQIHHTENSLADAIILTTEDEEDQQQQQQDLYTLLATLKQDLADADEQLNALLG